MGADWIHDTSAAMAREYNEALAVATDYVLETRQPCEVVLQVKAGDEIVSRTVTLFLDGDDVRMTWGEP